LAATDHIFIEDTAGGVAAGLITAGAGNVDLKSAGSITSGTVDGAADIVGATITLETTGAGATIGASAANRLELNATTLLNAKTAGLATEDIFILDTAGGVVAGLITAGAGNVDLKSAGSITSGTVDGAADIVGATVTLAVTGAANTIGTNATTGRLELNATTLNASTNLAATDHIFIEDTAGGVVAGLITAGAGNVDLKSAGSITSGTVDGAADIVGSNEILEA